jgi:hypothetical protein
MLDSLFFTLGWSNYTEAAKGVDTINPASPQNPTTSDRGSWGAVISSLSPATIAQYRRVGVGNTAALLQQIKRHFAGTTDVHVDLLETRLGELTLYSVGTFQELAVAMDNIFLSLEEAGRTIVESDKKFRLLKKLPAEYNFVKHNLKLSEGR